VGDCVARVWEIVLLGFGMIEVLLGETGIKHLTPGPVWGVESQNKCGRRFLKSRYFIFTLS